MPGLNLQPHDELDLSVVFTAIVEPRSEHTVDRARELRTMRGVSILYLPIEKYDRNLKGQT